jgi:23S rRNA pseudouridine2605 synthase
VSRERLQKYLARCGVASRRASEQIIVGRRVRVNGQIADELGTSIDPARDRVELDGRAVLPPTDLTYIALNKPIRVVSTASDPRGRRTVLDLVDVDSRIYPIGRLDYDSEGLILLTDDGDLAMHLTHPSHTVEKEYEALLSSEPSEEALARLRGGIMLDGTMTAPARVETLASGPDGTWVRFIIREGRNRQIRRMVEAVGQDEPEGLAVLRLVRVRIGSLRLGNLRSGQWRTLRPNEILALRGQRS